MPAVILASGSARRKKLLEEMGVSFTVMLSDADESVLEFIPGKAMEVAERKARDVFQRIKNQKNILVIGADTMVVLENKIFGKPEDRQQAYDTLKELSGKTHEVRTGLCVLSDNPDLCFRCEEVTEVTFRRLSEQEIKRYLDTGEAFDKAGSYGIQDQARYFVSGISGCFFNVIGLPVVRLYEYFLENKFIT